MTKHRRLSLVHHFLRTSPLCQFNKCQQVLHSTLVPNQMPNMPISNGSYLSAFLRSLEVFGTPISQLKHFQDPNQMHIRRLTKQQGRCNRSLDTSASQVEQLLHYIKQMSILNGISITTYQELQQRIVIAKPQTITETRVKLTYLFKILLNKRDKLLPQSLELQSNLQLCETIINAFARNADIRKDWNKLTAMQKLLRAREYKKQGHNTIALNSFEQIFKDDAAAYNTRLEALKILCLEGQQQGDISKLQSLVSLTNQRGEKEYEEYLKVIIEKIKRRDAPKSTDK